MTVGGEKHIVPTIKNEGDDAIEGIQVRVWGLSGEVCQAWSAELDPHEELELEYEYPPSTGHAVRLVVNGSRSIKRSEAELVRLTK